MHIGVEALRDRIQHTMEENMDKVDEETATLFKELDSKQTIFSKNKRN